jgi:hypothetical protein
MLHPALELARTADGRRRFYPPGLHPACARLRLILERLDEFGWGNSQKACLVRAEIAAFEESESEAKLAFVLKAGGGL